MKLFRYRSSEQQNDSNIFENAFRFLNRNGEPYCESIGDEVKTIALIQDSLSVGDFIYQGRLSDGSSPEGLKLSTDSWVVTSIHRQNEAIGFREDQANIILYPGCIDRNREYAQCAALAYLEEGQYEGDIPTHCENN